MNRGESLRDELERRYALGAYFTLDEAVAAMVPLIGSLAALHDDGARLFVCPSTIRFKPKGCAVDVDSAQSAPLFPRDRACMAPEERQGKPGDARASVFACGAMLYEMVTGEAVGPGMRRPTDLVPTLPESFELLLSKALVADPSHRPGDLAALAHALHQCEPAAARAPDGVEQDAFEQSVELDLDVSISMLPPAPSAGTRSLLEAEIARARAATASAHAASGGPVSGGPVVSSAPGSKGTTRRLAELKERLESDPRPRYLVIKEAMDHGPFSAVELLHQIATRNFTGDHPLRDTLSKDERPICEWPEFAPFAEQAQLGVAAQQERQRFEASVSAEKERAKLKTFAIGAAAVLGLAVLAGYYFRFGKRLADDGGVRGDRAQNVDFEGGVGRRQGKQLEGGAKLTGAGRGPSGDSDSSDNDSSGVSRPVVPGGLSCAGARARYIEDYSKDAPPDLSEGAYGAVLNRGDYLNTCGVPPAMAVTICAAVQNGVAVGVTVTTDPTNGGIARCISGQVRSLAFPSHPRLDVTNTVFAAQ